MTQPTVMTATFTEDELTPFTFERSVEAIDWALTTQLSRPPSDEVKALALAKIYLETGRLQFCHKFNPGNIKAAPAYVGMYTAFACNEVLDGKLVWFSPKGRLDKKGGVEIAEFFSAEPWHPQARFRAYANEYDGIDQYVDFIATGRYKVAWAKLLSGDVDGFVHELKMAKYFTADESLYKAGVEGLYKEILARLQKLPHIPIAPAVDHELILSMVDYGATFAHVGSAASSIELSNYA